MRVCRLCATGEVTASPPFDLCPGCAERLGVIPMPPPRRPPAPCDRCNRAEFIRVLPRELSDGMPAPMTATMIAKPDQGWFSFGQPEDPRPRHGRGVLEIYICRHCGFVEWYCLDPENIPLGPEHMADLVSFTSTDPYR